MAKERAQACKIGEIVLASVKKLMKNTGWTARTITKFVKMKYDNTDPLLNRKVRRALKRGVKLGVLKSQNGRYRLSKISGLARCVKCVRRPSSTELRRRQLRKQQRARCLRIQNAD